jgi:hypothetical protein
MTTEQQSYDGSYYYEGYYKPFLCKYEDLIDAISPWATVDAILTASAGLNHTFIVTFNRPISFNRNGVMTNMSGGHGILDSPFSLRGIYEGSSSLTTQILSNKMMAFDLSKGGLGGLNYFGLQEANKLNPDAKFNILKDRIKNKSYNESENKIIAELYSLSEQRQILLNWIRTIGQRILDKGLYLLGSDRHQEFSINDIITNYVENRWELIYSETDL